MKPRLINANALMKYCQNQKDKKVDCNDIARFPTYPTMEWHKVADGDLPNDERYVWTNQGPGYYDADGIWWDDFGRLRDVIAWCEPKFEE